MKTKRIIVLLAIFILGFSTFSYAGEIDYRIRQVQEQIERGLRSGALTKNEAHRLKDELNSVRDDEDRMKTDGRLHRYEREKLEKELDRLEKHIYRLKNDDGRRGRDVRSETHRPRWVQCATEGGYCKFEGKRNVRYGVGERWKLKTAMNGIPCNNNFFGDPAPRVEKACFVED